MVETNLTVPAALRPRLSPPRRLQLASLIVLSLIWEALSASGLLFRGVVPSIITVLASLFDLLTGSDFWFNLSITSLEIFVALAIGTSAGILVGMALGGSYFFGLAFEPYVRAVASIPKIILFPILLVVFGVGLGSKIAVGAIASFFPIALSTASGMRQVDPVLVRVGRSFRVSRLQMIWKIYLPSLVAPIMTGLRVALGIVIVVCLMGEIKYSNMGLGFMVMSSYRLVRFADMYAIIIVIFVLAAAGNAAIDRLIRLR